MKDFLFFIFVLFFILTSNFLYEQSGRKKAKEEIITHCLVYQGYDNFNTNEHKFYCGWRKNDKDTN